MKNPLDTLFGRLALTIVLLIVLVQVTVVLLVERSRADLDTMHIAHAVRAAMVVHDRDPVVATEMAQTMGISFVAADQLIASGCPWSCANTGGPLEKRLHQQLPFAARIVLDPAGTLWVQPDGRPYGLMLPHVILPRMRFLSVIVIMLTLALAASLLLTWQMHRPIRELTEAARAYRRDGRPRQVAMHGPSELRGLIGDFNDMVSELAQTERERAEMLASIAHDLRTPLTRIQVRADLLDGQRDRAAFLRDTESMGRIITQFIGFAGTEFDASEHISVDEHCRRNYTDVLDHGNGGDDALVKLELHAGPGFTLPSVNIDRILSNLIENAMTYGEPPVEISTALHQGHFMLVVRDHGRGVPEARLDQVLRPFVRLDVARGGNAHSGLGLAIVNRLVRHHGGTLTVSNAPGGGFVASMRFPLQAQPGITK
jgi:two-component system, OmpR family, osmolarity sensor histidine kinase EnvZ